MHGTGDDEKYWLKTNPYNKTMLDNMIADGDIEPLIVVTPTFMWKMTVQMIWIS